MKCRREAAGGVLLEIIAALALLSAMVVLVGQLLVMQRRVTSDLRAQDGARQAAANLLDDLVQLPWSELTQPATQPIVRQHEVEDAGYRCEVLVVDEGGAPPGKRVEVAVRPTGEEPRRVVRLTAWRYPDSEPQASAQEEPAR